MISKQRTIDHEEKRLSISSAFILMLALFLFVQNGCTPLHVACQNGHKKIVGILKGAGVDLEVKAAVS